MLGKSTWKGNSLPSAEYIGSSEKDVLEEQLLLYCLCYHHHRTADLSLRDDLYIYLYICIEVLLPLLSQ